MTQLRVAIALCTYNGEKYLRQQLDSLLAQTRLPNQIVIRDDVSSDGTWALLQQFCVQAAAVGIDVDLQRNPANLGYVKNFESALQACAADVIFLCDQDDIWHTEKVARMTAEFERRPQLGLLHTDAVLVDEAGVSLNSNLFETLEVTVRELADERAGGGFDVLLRRNIVTGAATALRADLVPSLLPIPDGWVHDEWLAMAVSTRADIDYLDWPAIDYRQHSANQIGVRKRSNREKLLRTGMPKRRFMAHVASRLERALEHLSNAGLNLSAGKARQIRDRIEHARLRSELPRQLLPRWRVVATELQGRRYWLYSSGWRSVVSDLLDLG